METTPCPGSRQRFPFGHPTGVDGVHAARAFLSIFFGQSVRVSFSVLAAKPKAFRIIFNNIDKASCASSQTCLCFHPKGERQPADKDEAMNTGICAVEAAYRTAKANITAFCTVNMLDEQGGDLEGFVGSVQDWRNAKIALIELCRSSLVAIASVGGYPATKIVTATEGAGERLWTIGEWNRLRDAVEGVGARDAQFWARYLHNIDWR